MDSNMEKRSRQLAREEVMQKLRAKRQFMYNSVGSYNWGNRFYPDITKEAGSNGPPPTKHPELWTWPCVDSGMEDQVDGLGNLLCGLDDDWSGIVKMVFLILYNQVDFGREEQTPGACFDIRPRPGRPRCTAAATQLFMVYESPDRDHYICVAVNTTGEHQNNDGTLKTESTSHLVSQILVIVGLILSSMDWWIQETLRHETFCFEGRVICNEVVKDIERMLDLLCRNVGQTRREEWMDEERLRAAGHLIIVKGSVRLVYENLLRENKHHPRIVVLQMS